MSTIGQKQRIIQNYSLLSIECLCMFISYPLALITRGLSNLEPGSFMIYFSTLFGAVFFHVLLYFLFDWNSGFFLRGYYVEAIAVLKYNICLAILLGSFLFITQMAQPYSRLSFFFFFLYNTLLTYGAHLLWKKYLISVYRNSSASNKVLVLTCKKDAKPILEQIVSYPGWSFQVTAVGIMDEDLVGTRILDIPVMVNASDYARQTLGLVVDEVFIHLPSMSAEQIEEIIQTFESMGVTIHVNVDFFSRITAHKTTESFAGFTVLSYEAASFDYRRMVIKRGIDIVGALVGIFFTLLITPFVALAIKLESKGPVVFSQIRVGKNGRHFRIYKFRSMYTDSEERKKELMKENEMEGPMFKLEHDPRITRVGSFLRKTSIDELPQFFNVLLGDMSLVGTRPPTLDEFLQYETEYRRRLSIKPGLTGMWQVSGRNNITDFQEVLKLDFEYIDHWSLTLDFKILLLTVWVVLARKGSK